MEEYGEERWRSRQLRLHGSLSQNKSTGVVILVRSAPVGTSAASSLWLSGPVDLSGVTAHLLFYASRCLNGEPFHTAGLLPK